jgi:large subunit ribosomal protein L1
MAEAKKKTVKKAEKPVKTEKVTKEVTEAVVEVATEEKVLAKAGKRSEKGIKEAEEKAEKEARKVERTAKSAKAEGDGGPKPNIKPARTKLERRGKKYRKAAELIEKDKLYTIKEALELATKTNPVKFDAAVELHINLNVDPKQADQNIRATVILPAGTGKNVRVAIADDDLLAKLDKEIVDFDVLVSTPDFMPKLSKYARLLGPKGLMPSPKSGTVTTDVKKAVTEAKAGKVEYRVDSTGIIHVAVGKVSFGTDKLEQNTAAVIASIKASKPASIKNQFVKSITATTTMGPGIKVAVTEI